MKRSKTEESELANRFEVQSYHLFERHLSCLPARLQWQQQEPQQVPLGIKKEVQESAGIHKTNHTNLCREKLRETRSGLLPTTILIKWRLLVPPKIGQEKTQLPVK